MAYYKKHRYYGYWLGGIKDEKRKFKKNNRIISSIDIVF